MSKTSHNFHLGDKVLHDLMIKNKLPFQLFEVFLGGLCMSFTAIRHLDVCIFYSDILKFCEFDVKNSFKSVNFI